MMGLQSPEEAFADIGAHLIMDNQASTYLDVEVVNWFKEKVFSKLKKFDPSNPSNSSIGSS
jgi:hypothetical protein